MASPPGRKGGKRAFPLVVIAGQVALLELIGRYRLHVHISARHCVKGQAHSAVLRACAHVDLLKRKTLQSCLWSQNLDLDIGLRNFQP